MERDNFLLLNQVLPATRRRADELDMALSSYFHRLYRLKDGGGRTDARFTMHGFGRFSRLLKRVVPPRYTAWIWVWNRSFSLLQARLVSPDPRIKL